MQQEEKLKKEALQFLAQEGFPIRERITISVDEKLPFMGYTTEKNGHPHIVVAKWALGTEMALGLVIHELGHVYHGEVGHSSHNFKIHQQVIQTVFQNTRLFPYQLEIIRNTINNLQDLYADDISFAVYKKHLHLGKLNEFFLGWIHDVLPNTSVENRWQNAGSLLNASFAQANLERHHIPDTGKKVETAVKEFLGKSDPKAATKFPYFKKFMVELPEKVSDERFRKLLTKYLREFAKVTNFL